MKWTASIYTEPIREISPRAINKTLSILYIEVRVRRIYCVIYANSLSDISVEYPNAPAAAPVVKLNI